MADTYGTAKVIAIVGAGYSGAFTAVNILRRNPGRRIRVVLVDRHTRPGRGLAYRTWDDNFLLNVPAGNMSALADDRDHFVRFCRNIDPAFNAATFISRRLYGDYLEFTLREAEPGSETPLEKICGEAISVRQQPGTAPYRVDLEDGRTLSADQVVLALGHFPPLAPAGTEGFSESGIYINNPWNAGALERIRGDAPVVLLGTGLTALNVLFRLTIIDDRRKVYLVSRRGLCPQPHRFHPKAPAATIFPPFLENLPPTVRAHCRALRQEIRKNTARGGDWRDTINALRPYTPEIWRRFSTDEQRKFLAHAAPYWDIHRHRLAPSAHLRLSGMIQSGQAEVIAGHVRQHLKNAEHPSVEVRERRTGRARKLDVGAIVNCTGPNCDISRIAAPLVVQLREEGYLLQDPARLGFEVNDHYQIIDCRGNPAKNLFYVGPMLKARLWEAIAVPELRVHTQRLAEILVSGR